MHFNKWIKQKKLSNRRSRSVELSTFRTSKRPCKLTWSTSISRTKKSINRSRNTLLTLRMDSLLSNSVITKKLRATMKELTSNTKFWLGLLIFTSTSNSMIMKWKNITLMESMKKILEGCLKLQRMLASAKSIPAIQLSPARVN